MNEEWRSIAGYEGLYEVSSLGRVRSLGRKIIRSNGFPQTFHPAIKHPAKEGYGYLQAKLTDANGEGRLIKVHRLVATAFLPNPDGLETVNHKDFNKENNSVENLEWSSRKQNMQHAAKYGRMCGFGNEKYGSKVTPEDAISIRLMVRSGQTAKSVAMLYGLSSSYVSAIGRGERWDASTVGEFRV